MNRWLCSAAVVFSLALSACSDTAQDSPLAPSGPRLDSGYIVGGNSTPQNTSTEASDTTTNRSGYLVGGN